jgi:hypothetical protein
MLERWLQSIWKAQEWNGVPLRTCQGHSIQVLDPGNWNTDQGPDFLEAKIFIDQVLWVGAVEVHVQSADWFRHRHATDRNYLPVILHVVWMQDPLHPSIPTLELSRYLTIPQLKQLLTQVIAVEQLPCHRIMRPVSDVCWTHWRSHLLTLRYNRKGMHPSASICSLRNRLARQLGAWVNRDVFESIDSSLSEELIRTYERDLQSLLALYLGQGGQLKEDRSGLDDHSLGALYAKLRFHHSLNPPYRQLLWMRIRPAGNPAFRLMQLAILVFHQWHRREKWSVHSVDEIRQSIRSIDPTGLIESPRQSLFSDSLIDLLLINLWAYIQASDPFCLEADLRQFEFEDNRHTRAFERLALKDPTAADSQALLELHQSYCRAKNCRACALGKEWTQDQGPQSI